MSGMIIGNRYELIEKIGSGGMAIVYKAKCRLLNRYVAIKMLRPEFNDDAEFLKRFETEAQAAASLSHTNIVSVYDVGTHDNIHYIVMEYAEGVTLKKYMADKGALPMDEVIDFSMQIAMALEHAHSKGIIHHDIKPHNIMVGENGLLKVADFGLARAVSGSTNVASTTAFGSVHYSSPEQSRGGFTDEKSDIYSLGVTMYEMATGRVPFDGETPISVAMKHMQKQPTPPSQINPAVTPEFEEIILRAMEKEPRDRYQKVSDLIQDLDRVKEGGDIVAVIKNDKDETDEKFATKKFEPVNGENGAESTPPEEKSPAGNDEGLRESTKKNKKKEIVTVVAAIFTTIAIVSLLVFIFAKLDSDGFGANEKISVPKFVGLKYEDAEKIAEEQGFLLDVETEESDDEEGIVLRQDPEEGYKINKGGTVSVVISETESGVVLINYVGKEYEKAIKALETLGIKYIIKEEYNDSVELGRIIRMDPMPGTSVSEDETVTLYVSLGRDDTKKTAPDLYGKTISEAINILAGDDLQLGSVTSEPSDSDTGKVIGQSPAAGSTVEAGSRVDIVISEKREQKPPEPEGNDETDESEENRINISSEPENSDREISDEIKVE